MLADTDDSGRPLFSLSEAYVYPLGPGSSVTVPEGYVTNFGTIPRWFSWIVSPVELREAAIVHDFMCNESFDGDELDSGYSR